MKKQTGFTLIQFMIVGAVIAISAAIVIPIGMANKLTPEQSAERDAAWKQGQAEKFVRGLVYIKDARTGLCYACRDLGLYGQTMTLVPESAIPAELLTIGDVAKEEKK